MSDHHTHTLADAGRFDRAHHDGHHDNRPTRAELDADERTDILAGMHRCRFGCPQWFHGPDTTAALAHEAAHEETA